MRKRIVNLSFGLAITAAFFLLLEVALWVFGVRPVQDLSDPFVGYSAASPLFTAEGDFLVTALNKRTAFNLQRFPKKKGINTFRIFSLGGSTTYGHPYEDPVSFSGWLRKLLPAADPGKTWEVINCGGISYASYRVAKLMEELNRYEPDLYVVYCGHNEFLEERTYRQVAAIHPLLRDTASVLGHTRTYSALQGLYRKIKADPTAEDQGKYTLPGEVKTILEITYGPTTYRRDDGLRRQILEHYRLSLRRMVELARSAGAEVVFVTTPVNLRDCSPFKSQHRDGQGPDEFRKFNEQMAAGLQLEGRKLNEAALRRYREALRLDDRFAEAQYRAGKVLFALGRMEEASEHLLRAAEEDVCPLRALEEIRAAVRKTAADFHAPLVDFDAEMRRTLREKEGHAIPGDENFLDHVHPTIENHRLVALRVIDRMAEAGMLHASSQWGAGAVERVSQEITAGIDTVAQGVALHTLAKVINWAGKYEDAARIAARGLALAPDHLQAFTSLLYVGTARERAGDREGAISYYRRALRLNPNNPEVRYLLGAALVRKGDWAGAREHLETALSFDPQSRRLPAPLLDAWEKTAPPDSAAAFFEAAIRLQPGDPSLYYLLGRVRLAAGRMREAEQAFNNAVDIMPNYAPALYELGVRALARGSRPEAISRFEAALRAEPGMHEARKQLMATLSGSEEKKVGSHAPAK
jgi:tetratricopeptide (TPR) repeat protein